MTDVAINLLRMTFIYCTLKIKQHQKDVELGTKQIWTATLTVNFRRGETTSTTTLAGRTSPHYWWTSLDCQMPAAWVGEGHQQVPALNQGSMPDADIGTQAKVNTIIIK